MQLGTSVTPASFAPYEIRSPLGRGGMGQVYRAWDPRLEREVALKVLHDHAGTGPERLRRFVAEARAASALNHPNILTVFDAAVDGATPYIVSELIEGESLRDEIRRGPIAIKRLLDLATQIADGLAEAHGAGIVHRDLKPENIMVTRAGRAKILDFGLAQPTGLQSPAEIPVELSGETLTEPGLLAGTVPYMSPEQARGGQTDFRSDQFSFGLILYEIATGQPAFRRETPAATLDAIVDEEPPPLSALTPHAPLLLSWIIERCLAKHPTDRYGVTADLLRDLRTLRDRLPEAVARERVTARHGGPRRALALRMLPLLLLAIALAAAVGSIWRMTADVSRVDVSAVQFMPLATDASFEGYPAWSPNGEIVAYSAEVEGVLQIFTRRLSAPTPAQVTNCPYDCKHPFWAPDGKRIYYVSQAREREGIWSVGAAGGTPQVVVENATRGALSPDGRTLAFLRDEQRADIVGTAALWQSSPDGPAPWSSESVEDAARKVDAFGALRFIDGVLAFSPDGRKLGVCAVPGLQDERMWQFWIVPMPAGAAYRRLEWWEDAGPQISSFTWLPDSRHVALGMRSLSTPGSHLWIADLDGDRAWPMTRSADSEHYPSASPNGEQVVFTRGEPDYDLTQIPLDGRPPRPIVATSRNESDPVWSPDGRLLAYVSDRSGQDEIWIRTRDGSEPDRRVIGQGDFGPDRTVMLSAPAFSSDGQRIAYQRNGFKPRWPLRIWISFTAGGMPAPLLAPEHQGLQSAPAWSPDGLWIAFAQWRDRQWELAKVRVGSGEGPEVLRTDGVANATPRWSPKGDWITWETAEAFVLVSPDGRQQRELRADQWLVHAWSPDGSLIYGIRETDDLRLSLVAVDARNGTARAIADLGPSPPLNNPVKGLSLTPDGRAVVTSFARSRGDLWIAGGLRWRRNLWQWLTGSNPSGPIEIP